MIFEWLLDGFNAVELDTPIEGGRQRFNDMSDEETTLVTCNMRDVPKPAVLQRVECFWLKDRSTSLQRIPSRVGAFSVVSTATASSCFILSRIAWFGHNPSKLAMFGLLKRGKFCNRTLAHPITKRVSC